MKVKVLLLAFTLLFSSLCVLPSAQAASKGWRYWGYFQAAPGKNMWTAAMTGPSVDVVDGSVDGWSFVFSSFGGSCTCILLVRSRARTTI